MKLGATAVVNPVKENPAEKVRSLTGRLPEVVFECIGVKSTLDAAINMVDLHGRVVVLGVCMEPDEIRPLTCILKEISIDFIVGYTRAEFQETIDALASKRIDPRLTREGNGGISALILGFGFSRRVRKLTFSSRLRPRLSGLQAIHLLALAQV
jgi:threonine dehydrogenase-like Zn-dependent dehydrogenase